jgi:hypothetical protein
MKKKIVVLYIDAMARDFKLLFKKRRSRCHASLLYHITIFFLLFSPNRMISFVNMEPYES